MDVYNACLATARLFETNPEAYDYWNTGVPACGTPGCVLGNIGMLAGVPRASGIWEVAELMGIGDSLIFYNRMGAIRRELKLKESWHYSPESAAQCLRVYAETYHKPALDPAYLKLRASLEVDAALRETA